MSKPRGSDMSQKQASKGPMPIRVSRSCDSDPLHRRPVTQRSPRLGERRGTQSESSNQKKLGSRISDLESQLGQAQEELKILKGHMNTVKIKRATTREQQADKNSKNPSRNPPPKEESSNDNDPETDVFEVPVEEILLPGKRKEEIHLLKAMLEEKMKELDNSHQENEKLKSEMEKRGSGVSSAEAKEEEMRIRMNEIMQELEGNRGKTEKLVVKLEAMEAEKQEMEAEMMKLRIQTEQWRKAADAAAIILSEGGGGSGGGTEMKERRISERWGSMDKHNYGNIFENPVGGFPEDIDEEEFAGNGKRRSSGIRMLGELWKKKGHK